MEAHPATVEVISRSTIIPVNNSGFKQLITRDPKLNLKIIGTLVKWLSQMRDALSDLSLKAVESVPHPCHNLCFKLLLDAPQCSRWKRRNPLQIGQFRQSQQIGHIDPQRV